MESSCGLLVASPCFSTQPRCTSCCHGITMHPWALSWTQVYLLWKWRVSQSLRDVDIAWGLGSGVRGGRPEIGWSEVWTMNLELPLMAVYSADVWVIDTHWGRKCLISGVYLPFKMDSSLKYVYVLNLCFSCWSQTGSFKTDYSILMSVKPYAFIGLFQYICMVLIYKWQWV